jgi:hypothetical protein
MNDINLDSVGSVAILRDTIKSPYSRPAGDEESSPGDRVEISELAGFLSRLSDLPDTRARKIVDVRSAIQNGTYESPEKLDYAVDRLLANL